MIDALQRIAVPHLRSKGFRGTFPHFRRTAGNDLHLLTFQFDRHGGGFVVELGRAMASGYTTTWGKNIAPEELTAWDLKPTERSRLSPDVFHTQDYWFRYDQLTLLPFTKRYDKVAAHLVSLYGQAELWWADKANP